MWACSSVQSDWGLHFVLDAYSLCVVQHCSVTVTLWWEKSCDVMASGRNTVRKVMRKKEFYIVHENMCTITAMLFSNKILGL